MPGRVSAKRYAQAIFDLARENGQVERWGDDMRQVVETLQNQELRAFLEHAKVPLHSKVSTIHEIFQGAEPLVRNLTSLLVSRGLVDLVSEVEVFYRRLLNDLMSREQAEVRSAVPLGDPEKERISSFLTALINKDVVLESRVDPSILGGLVIKVGDKLIDGSTRTRLDDLGKRLQSNISIAGV